MSLKNRKLNLMNLYPPALDSTKSLNFSYPINYEYPNSVSFSGVHAGFLMAYGSSNLIIVLIEGKYISAVLQGHETTVCTVSFEIRGPHILSCDISGKCFFWHYQDSIWQNSRNVQLKSPLISASWYTSRREICYTCSDGLYHCSLTDFGTTSEKLCNKSSFCTYNFDGTLLASHNNKLTLSIFMFTANTYLTQVLKHPSPIATFDFHPSLPSFLTITNDHILRIYRQSILSGFACTAAIEVPITGYFVRNPFFYSDPSAFGPQNPTTILFVDPQHNFYKLRVEENGLIKNSEDGNPFRNLQVTDDFGFRAVYKTNLGTESIIVSKTKISIVSRQQTRELLFHTSNITNTEFAPDNFWLYTLDFGKRLIVWPIFNPYHLPKEVSNHAKLAVWKDSNNLVFQEEKQKDHLMIYDAFHNEIREFDFPLINNLRKLYSNNGEIYAITNNSIISKSVNDHQINEFNHIAISQPFNNHFIITFSSPKNYRLSTLLCPEMKNIPCSTRTGKIKDIAFISFLLFSVLTDNEIEIWSFKDEVSGYECVNKVYLPGMSQIFSDTSTIGGRLLSHDERHIFSISNGVVPLLTSNGITKVCSSSFGHIVVFYGKHFRAYPSWCITKQNNQFISINVGLSQSDELLNIGNLSQDAKFIQKVTIPPTINYMVSPLTYVHPVESNILTIQSTLFHLLECKIITNLDNCSPEQIPAIPNQYAIPFALEFPNDFTNTEYENLINQIKNVPEDIDMFGLRYLLVIKENAWPPSYFALWLSYSQSQSQIAEHIIKFIDANMLSKFYIAASIHSHSILVKIVQHSLINMWSAFQKVDNVALLYAALGQLSAISKLYSAIGDDLRADFFKHDFKVERWRKFAVKNAYSSLSHHNLEMSATLFLIAGDINLCINIIVMKLEDPMLAFLVLRLLTKSNYKSKEMQNFFKLVNWSDEVIPILISNLFKDGQVESLLEKLILEKEKSKNITAFGDRRITLFELYHYITKKSEISTQLIINMNQDGLAPLSNYVYGIVNCPYQTFRSVEMIENDLINDNSNEPEKQPSLIELGEKITIEKVNDFDFGGGGIDYFDDDWSDDEEENEKEENIVKVDDQIKNEKTLFFINQKKETKDKTIFDLFLSTLTQSLCNFYGKLVNDITDENAGSFAMRTSSIRVASRLLPQHKRNILFKQISLFIDDCCALFYQSAEIPLTPKILLELILKFFHNIIHFETSTSLQNQQSQQQLPQNTNQTITETNNNNTSNKISMKNPNNNQVENPINELIVEKCNNNDNNKNNSNNSSRILIKQQHSSILPDGEMSMKDPDFSSLDINKIMQYRNYKFIHSVFNGAVVVATWTYFPQFLAQLLDESIETICINKDSIPDPQSFFDVDISSPRFPDSIPLLLSRYTNGADQVASFERSRFLIMLLLFQRIRSMNAKLLTKASKTKSSKPNNNNNDEEDNDDENGYNSFLSKMDERYKSMQKTFQFYEVALGSPLLEQPVPDTDNSCGPISRIIDKVFSDNLSDLQEIHAKSLQRQSFPPIYRKGSLSVGASKENRHSFNSIRCISTMPIEKDKFICVADGNLIKADFTNQSNPIFTRFNDLKIQNQNFSDVISVISHPTYNLFICVLPTSAYLLSEGKNSDGKDIMIIESKIILSTQSKTTCAAFSPNSAKFAICSTTLDIFSFDLSKNDMSPIISRKMKGQITAVAWVNSETCIAVAYTNTGGGYGSSNTSSIVVINTLMKYDQPIEVKKEWGNVTTIVTNIRKGKLVFGTKNGFTIITDINRNFEATYIIKLNVHITSMCSMQELIAVGTENGNVIVFSTSKPTKSSQFETSYKINSLILSEKMILAAGDSQIFSVWNAL